MHMLTKYRRLLNEITEIFQVTPIAFVIADFLTLPFLKWMRTTATNGEVLLCSTRVIICCIADNSALAWSILRQTPVAISSILSVISCFTSPAVSRALRRQSAGRILTQVVARRIDHLHFQFNA
jgi:hypothetical protein